MDAEKEKKLAKTENKGISSGNSSIVIYRTKDGKVNLNIKFDRETIWLTQKQIAQLFLTERSVITRHLKNIFRSGELSEKSNVQNLHIAFSDKPVKFYNLDAIISVGYRVNSQRATQFRIWATKTLKDYLIQGYAINQKRLAEQSAKLKELQDTIKFIKTKSSHPELSGQTQELLNIINEYSNSLTLLYQYDKGTLKEIRGKKPEFVLTYKDSQKLIGQVKVSLAKKSEATNLFGQEINYKFNSIIGAIYQTFDKKELYPSVAGKVANLLYLTIKDHPFVDGNKRIGSLLFIYFLEKNNYLHKENGERKIDDGTIVTLALLIANSEPKEKEVMIKIITNLLR